MALHTKSMLVIVVISFFLAILPSSTSLPPKPIVAPQGGSDAFVKTNIASTMTKTQDFLRDVIEKRLADKNLDQSNKVCLEQCKEVYESAIDSMKKATEDVNVRDYYKANLDIGAMNTFISTCNDCAEETFSDAVAFKNFSNMARNIASDCLAKITTH